jgi:hypothetical protein
LSIPVKIRPAGIQIDSGEFSLSKRRLVAVLEALTIAASGFAVVGVLPGRAAQQSTAMSCEWCVAPKQGDSK